MNWRFLQEEAQFSRLLSANFISGLGDWFNRVAVTSLVLSFTHTGLPVGIVLGLRALVYLLVGPFAGILADRFSRKAILIVADCARILFACTFLLVTSVDQLWLVYLGTIGLEVFSALYAPARSAVIPQLVQADHVHTANSINQVVLGSVMALGSLLAGVVTVLWGVHIGFIVNALSFVASATLTMTITLSPIEKTVKEQTEDTGTFREVWPLLSTSPAVQSMAVFFSLWPLGGGAVNVLISVYAFRVFHAGDVGVGLLYGALGLGFFIGGFLSVSLSKWLRVAIMLAFIIEGLGQLAVSQAPTIWVAALLMIIATIGASIGNGGVSTLIMQVTRLGIQGRVFSLLDTMSNIILCLSMFTSGFLVDVIGPRVLGSSAGIVLVITAVAAGIILLRANFIVGSLERAQK